MFIGRTDLKKRPLKICPPASAIQSPPCFLFLCHSLPNLWFCDPHALALEVPPRPGSVLSAGTNPTRHSSQGPNSPPSGSFPAASAPSSVSITCYQVTTQHPGHVSWRALSARWTRRTHTCLSPHLRGRMGQEGQHHPSPAGHNFSTMSLSRVRLFETP